MVVPLAGTLRLTYHWFRLPKTKMMLRFSISRLINLLTVAGLTYGGVQPAFARATGDQRRLGEAAGEIIGFHTGLTIGLQRCSVAYPEQKTQFYNRFLEIEKLNSQIVTMARLKALALAEVLEGVQGRQKAEKLFLEDIRAQATEYVEQQVSSPKTSGSFCQGKLNPDPTPLSIFGRFPQQYSFVADFRVGYPQRFPGCEYQTTFPLRPDIQFIEEGGAKMMRAMTPAPSEQTSSLPTISSVCAPLVEGSKKKTVDYLKLNGKTALQQFGIENIRMREEEISDKGSVLTAIGQKNAGGFPVIME
jgi:hypothetical protein